MCPKSLDISSQPAPQEDNTAIDFQVRQGSFHDSLRGRPGIACGHRTDTIPAWSQLGAPIKKCKSSGIRVSRVSKACRNLLCEIFQFFNRGNGFKFISKHFVGPKSVDHTSIYWRRRLQEVLVVPS